MLRFNLCILWIVLSIHSTYGYDGDTLYILQLIKQARSLQSTYPDSSYKLAQGILNQSEILDYKTGKSAAYMRMGSILIQRGDNAEALHFILKSYNIRKKMGDFAGVSNACLQLSYIYSSLGKIDSTFYFLFEALKQNKLIGNEEDLAEINIEIGNAYIAYKEPALSLPYYFEAEKIAKHLQQKDKLVGVYTGLGNYYFNQQSYPTALTYFLICDSLLQNESDPISTGKTQNNLALCYDQMRNYPKAYQYYNLAIKNYNDLNLINDLALTYYNMGNMFNTRNMPDSAITHLTKSLSFAKQIADINRIAECYDFLADAYLLKKDYRQAYQFLLQSKTTKDSLLTAEKINSISEMKTKYETELKEKEIENLNIQNKSRTIQRNGLILGTILLLLSLWGVINQRNRTKQEMVKSEQLLLNILPSEIAKELKQTGSAVAKQYNHVTVMFTDFVNFTGISGQLSPEELVQELHQNFTAFDAIMEKYGVEKIKTIGDAYLAVCGLPHEHKDHAQRVTQAALEIQDYLTHNHGKFKIRIGIHSGAVVAGIVGIKKFAYDIWGDTVNMASRMESNSEVGKINISQATYELIKDDFEFEYRGKINAKNKGELDMYFVYKILNKG